MRSLLIEGKTSMTETTIKRIKQDQRTGRCEAINLIGDATSCCRD